MSNEKPLPDPWPMKKMSPEKLRKMFEEATPVVTCEKNLLI